MTPLIQFLSDLRSLGVMLSLDGDRLKCNAPKGVIDAALRSKLAERKEEILAFLRQSAAGEVSGSAAEMPAELPLSRSQHRLWFVEQLDAGNPVHHIVLPLRLTGTLHRQAFEQSLIRLVQRHEPLRTAFHQRDGKPYAAIVNGDSWKPGYVDLAHLPEAEATVEAHTRAIAEARRPFTLEEAPLFRAVLYRLAPDTHVLLLVVHHMVADGWSLGVLTRELGLLYTTLCAGQTPALPPLPARFHDFVRWEAENGEQLAAAQMPFWLEHLGGPLPSLELAPESRRPPMQTFAGKRSLIEIEAPLAERIRELCRSNGVTPFMYLLAAFDLLLHRYTGHADILVGSVTANRQRQEFEALVGFFVSTLVLRSRLDGNPTFGEFLQQVKETARSIFAHQEMPFDLLVEKLQPERALNQNPLVQVMFTVQNLPIHGFALPGLAVEREPLDPGIARADLSIEVWPEGKGWQCHFEYSTELFDPEFIETLQRHYLRLLQEVTANLSVRVNDLSLLSSAERHRLLVEWNGAASPATGQTIVSAFEKSAAAVPNKVAVVCGGEQLRYEELQRLYASIASHLNRLDLPPHSVIAVCAPGTPLAIAAFLGVLRAGHVCLAIDDPLQMEWFGRAEVAVLLTSRSLAKMRSSASVPQVHALEDLVAGEPESFAAPSVTPDDPAWVLFTAGGRKAVVLPHRALVHQAQAIPLTAEDAVAQSSSQSSPQIWSWSSSFAAWEIWGTLLHGARLVLRSANRREDSEADAALQSQGITTRFLPTAIFHEIVASRPESLRGVRQVVIGGEAPSPHHLRRILEELPGLRILHAYSVTENGGFTALQTITASSLEDFGVPLGRPVTGTQLFVLDPAGQPVPPGVSGELYVAGEGLALGYRGLRDGDAEAFVTLEFPELGAVRAFRTGDLARWRGDGLLEWVGRVDRLIHLRGNRIDPRPIEQALLGLTGVEAAVVFLRGDHLAAAIVAAQGSSLDLRMLPMELRDLLPVHLIPAAFLLAPAIPLTSAGKIDIAALEALPPVAEDETAAGASASAHDRQLALYRAVLRSQQDTSSPAHQNRTSEEYPLSRSQRRLWFLDQLDPGNAVYNIAIAMRMDGALDRSALESALRELIDRHESLRTTFLEREGVPWAKVGSGVPWSVAFTDLSSLTEHAQTDELARLIPDESGRPFNLAEGPLFRASLYKKAAREHVVLLVMHHIISDGWSIGVLAREIAALYRARVHNQPSPLPPLTAQYRDFVAWEQQHQENAAGKDLAYWRRQLGGELPQLELPIDHARPPVQSFRGGRVTVDIAPELEEHLQQLARQHNATLYMVLLAAFNVLLRHYTRQEDLLIGTPTAGRLSSDFEGLIGFFVNNLVLRVDLSGDPTFAEVIRRVRTVALDAFEHQSTPFDQLVETLQPERTLDRSPLFQVLFTLQNAPLTKARLDDLEIAPLEFQGFRARYDLAVDIYPYEGRSRCDFEFNTDIFEEATVRQMLAHYLRLLTSVCDEVSQPIRKLALLSAEERKLLLEDWNRTDMPLPPYATVAAWFRAQARQTPAATALVMGDRKLTYEELDAASDRMAELLRDRGAGPETVVGVYLQRSPEMVIGLLGILKARGAYLPIDPAFPPQRIEFLLADAEVPLLLTQQSLCETLPAITANLLVMEEILEGMEDEDARPFADSALAEQDQVDQGPGDELAYLIYTSGSTGKPKGTEIPQSALVNLLASMLREPGLSGRDTLLAITTLSFDIAGLEIWGPLVCGATLVLAFREQVVNPEALADLIQSSGATVLQATPSTWRMLIESGWLGQAGLRMWCGGEGLPPEVAESLLTRGSELWNLYGPTETTIWSAAHRVRSGENPILIGRPIANTQMYILDANGQPVPPGVPGELYIGGDGVARGYWRRPDLTQSRFLADPFDPAGRRRMYRTGDLARYRRDGQIQLLGRTDHQIKLRGHRIEPGEIEAVIERHPEIRQAVVVVHGEGSRAQLVGYVRYGTGAGDTERLRSWLQERLPEYMVPALLMALTEMPLTPNGKVDRKRLPSPQAAPRERGGSSIPARNQTEQKLAELWADLLRVERPGVRENFFDLGGHSLLLVQLHARLRREIDAGITIVDLFRYTTIETLAAFLDRRRQSTAQTVGAGA